MGLRYVSSDSQQLIEKMHHNLAIADSTAEQLKSGCYQLTAAVDNHTLCGATYTAGRDLFTNLIVPTIYRVTSSVDDIRLDLNQYRNADSMVADWGYLDEDNLQQQITVKRRMKDSIDTAADSYRKIRKKTSSMAIADRLYEMEMRLRRTSENLQNELDNLHDQLNRLYEFATQTNGLFCDNIENLNIAMQSVLVLNETTVNSDGTYSLPEGKDKSWFTELKVITKTKRELYDEALSELLTYEKDGRIKKVDFPKLEKWCGLFAEGKLTQAQAEAVRTAILTIPGYLDKQAGMEDEVNEFLQKLAVLQDIIGMGWPIFGFAYDKEGQHFYTMQDSTQSAFGFGNIYDKAAPALGMDLDTALVQFEYEGKEYRFQVWKGTYGGGTLAGGEQGWYVYDPNNPKQRPLNTIADMLGQEDLVPVAEPEDRIRMVNTLYNETTGKRLADASDTAKFAPEGAYWNLETSALDPGYVKSNIYAKGKLYIEDEGLRNKMYEELKANNAFSDVQIEGNERVVYTWSD